MQVVPGLAYCSASASMILLNKLALSRYDFHLLTMLLIFQCTFCVLAVKATAMAGIIQLEVCSMAEVQKLVRASLWSCDAYSMLRCCHIAAMELEHRKTLVPGELHLRRDAVDKLSVLAAAERWDGHSPEEPDKLFRHFW